MVGAAAAGLPALADVSGADLLVVTALLAGLALAVVSPLGLLCAAIAALPWFFRPLELGGQRLAASELLLALALVGFATRFAVAMARQPSLFPQRSRYLITACLRSPLVVAAAALAALGFALALFPFDPTHRAESVREWRWTLAEPLLLLALLTWQRREPSIRPLVAASLLAGITVASLQGGADLLLDRGLSVEGVTRISGPYPHPNALALMTARGVAFAVALAAFDRRARVVLLPVVAICGAALIATFSRGAMLAVAVAVVLSLPALRPRLRLAVASLGALGLLALTLLARDRMLDAFGGGSGSLRVDIWESATRMIAARPIAGYGPDQFLYAYLPRYVQPTAWDERFTAHAHNLLLDAWVRLGIIGAAFAAVTVVVCARAALRAARRPVAAAPVRRAAMVALAAVLVHGMLDNAYFAHDLAMSSWLLAWLAFERQPAPTGEGDASGARRGNGRGRVHRLASVR